MSGNIKLTNILILSDLYFNDINLFDSYFYRNTSKDNNANNVNDINDKNIYLLVKNINNLFYKHLKEKNKQIHIVQEFKDIKIDTIKQIFMFVSNNESKLKHEKKLKTLKKKNNVSTDIDIQTFISSKISKFMHFKDKDIVTESLNATYEKLGLVNNNRNVNIMKRFAKIKVSNAKKRSRLKSTSSHSSASSYSSNKKNKKNNKNTNKIINIDNIENIDNVDHVDNSENIHTLKLETYD